MKYALLLIATILFAVPVSAEEYEKGPNGGLMLDVDIVPEGTAAAEGLFVGPA